MSNNPNYDACIAAGNSPAVCAATFGSPEGDGATLDDYIGLPFLNPATGAEGILKKFQAGRGQPAYYLDFPGTAGAGQTGGQRLLAGSLILDPRTKQSLTIGEGGMFTAQKLSDSDMERMFGTSFGGASAAPAFTSTEAGMRLQYELEDALRRGDAARAAQLQKDILAEQQRFQAEQNRLAEEAALKRERFGVLQNLVEGFLQSQQRASEFMLQIQPDPFKFAAAAQGMPVLGTTPQEGYAGALQEFTQRPAPSMDPNAPLSAIEGGISSIMGQQMPLQPGMFGGMSGGGTVPMGASGTFLVGEGGPEVMDVTPSGVTVRPLSGGFQYGGGVDFDVSSMMAGLAPLYAGLGFQGIPTAGRGPMGMVDFRGQPGAAGWGGTGREFLGALGINPNLIHNRETGEVFYVEPDGTMRHISSPRAFENFGFRWSDVVNLSPETIAEFGWEKGSRLREAPQFPSGPIGPMGSMPFPIIEPTTGAVLPAPYRIAAERRRLASVNPQLYDIGTYAYNFPNSPIMPGALKTAEDIYTPRGMARGPIGLR